MLHSSFRLDIHLFRKFYCISLSLSLALNLASGFVLGGNIGKRWVMSVDLREYITTISIYLLLVSLLIRDRAPVLNMGAGRGTGRLGLIEVLAGSRAWSRRAPAKLRYISQISLPFLSLSSVILSIHIMRECFVKMWLQLWEEMPRSMGEECKLSIRQDGKISCFSSPRNKSRFPRAFPSDLNNTWSYPRFTYSVISLYLKRVPSAPLLLILWSILCCQGFPGPWPNLVCIVVISAS